MYCSMLELNSWLKHLFRHLKYLVSTDEWLRYDQKCIRLWHNLSLSSNRVIKILEMPKFCIIYTEIIHRLSWKSCLLYPNGLLWMLWIYSTFAQTHNQDFWMWVILTEYDQSSVTNQLSKTPPSKGTFTQLTKNVSPMPPLFWWKI